MAAGKGEILEELVREFFNQEGYYAVRSVPFKAQGNAVTDVDVWLYRRIGSARSRSIVDVKSKKSPRAFERVLWVTGLKTILAADRGIIATTDGSDAANRFAAEHGIHLVTRSAVTTEPVRNALKTRLNLEDFQQQIRSYESQKIDGDWIARLEDARSSLISANGFQAFNKSANHFRFFAERLITRPQQRDVALRCMFQAAGICCVALDIALQPVEFATQQERQEFILRGVIYGESNSGRVVGLLNRVLNLVSSSIENGDVIRNKIVKSLDEQFSDLRADVIAEYFSARDRSNDLFEAARYFDKLSFQSIELLISSLPTNAKSILGIMCDFSSIPRQKVFSENSKEPSSNSQGTLL